jgi:hypothetical protein
VTITLERTPRGEVTVRTNECLNPYPRGTTNGWSFTWFGTGGTGTNNVQPDALNKAWTNTPTNSGAEDAGFRYRHSSWTGSSPRTCSAYIYPNYFEPKVGIKARYYDAGGTLLRVDNSVPVQMVLNQGWQRITGSFSGPSNTAYVDVDFVLFPGNTPQNGQGISLQRVLIESGWTVGTYFDGNTWAGGNGTQRTVWTGAADASGSQVLDWDPATKWSPQLVEGYDVGQQSRNIIHQLADGPVAATILPASTRQGTLKLFFLDAASAETARKTLATAGTWTFTDTDQGQESMTFAVDGQLRKTQSDNRLRWRVEVPYRELS